MFCKIYFSSYFITSAIDNNVAMIFNMVSDISAIIATFCISALGNVACKTSGATWWPNSHLIEVGKLAIYEMTQVADSIPVSVVSLTILHVEWNWNWYPSEKLHFPLIWKRADRKWMRANAIVFQRNPSVRSARQLQLGCLGTHLLIITHRQMWANRRPVTPALWQSQGQGWLSSAKLLNYLFVVKLNLCRLKHQSVWF